MTCLVMDTKIFEDIKSNFNGKMYVKEKRPNIYQLYLPVYHEDGDMVDIFIAPQNDNSYQLCDFGMTLMHLSYDYNIDTDNKEKIFQKIVSENSLTENNGNICYTATPDNIYPALLHYTQALMKIGSMRYFKREVIESLFYEMLDEYIMKELTEFKPRKQALPLTDRDDLEVDYTFTPNGHDVYLFAVKDATKARLATISCLEFERNDLNFRSLVVHDDFEKLPKKDRSRLTNACDKQFTSLEDFKSQAVKFLEREKNL
jgi:hypothetical protein